MSIDFISKYRLKQLHKKHPKKVCAFLCIKQFSSETLSKLNNEIVNQLLAFSKQDLQNWDELLLTANQLHKKYKNIILTYIKENFGKTNLDFLSLNELKLLNMETDTYWQKLVLERQEIEEITKDYPDGVRLYKAIHKGCNSKSIIKELVEVVALQERFNYSQQSKEALDKCSTFSKEVIEILNSKTFKSNHTTSLCNTSIYDEFGHKVNRKIPIQITYMNAYSPYRLDEQGEKLQETYSIYEGLKNGDKSWVDGVYNQYAELFSELDDKYHKDICFIFIKPKEENVSKKQFEYHSIKLLRKLKNGINAFYFDEERWREGNYQYFVILDFFAIHEDIIININTILQTKDILPSIIYLTFIREMTKREIDRIIDDHNYLSNCSK